VPSRKKILVLHLAGQYPLAGVLWQALHYLGMVWLGLHLRMPSVSHRRVGRIVVSSAEPIQNGSEIYSALPSYPISFFISKPRLAF